MYISHGKKEQKECTARTDLLWTDTETSETLNSLGYTSANLYQHVNNW